MASSHKAHRFCGRLVKSLAGLLLCSAGLLAQSTLNPPVDGVFDWQGRARTLKIVVDNTAQTDTDGKVIVPGAANFQVAPCPPDGTDVATPGRCKPLKQNGNYRLPVC